MGTLKFYLAGFFKILLATAGVFGAVAAYRLLLDPLLSSALGLGDSAVVFWRRWNVFLIVALAYAAFVKFYEKRPIRELAPRWRAILLGAAAGALSIGVTIAILFAAGLYVAESTRAIGPALGLFGMIWTAAFFEEITFRGILFRIVEERAGSRWALAISAIVFGAMHLANDGARVITFFSVTLIGLMWAGVYMVSRNLWVAAAHHSCWNATIFATGLPLSGDTEWILKAPLVTRVTGPEWLSGGAFGPEDSLLNLVVSAAICVLLWRLAKRWGHVRERPSLPERSSAL